MGETFRGRQGAHQIHMHVTEAAGRHRNVPSSHVHVLVDLTLLAGEAGARHGGHIGGGTFPYKPGEDEASGGPRVRVGNPVDCFKYLLFEGGGDNGPENTGADVPEEGVAFHVLRAELEVGLGT